MKAYAKRFVLLGARSVGILVLAAVVVVHLNQRYYQRFHPSPHSRWREEVRPWELRWPLPPRQLSLEESLGIGLLREGSYTAYSDCGGALRRYLNPAAGHYLVEHFENLPEGLPPYAAPSNQHPQDPRGRMLAVLGMLDTDPRFFEGRIIERVQEISPPEDAESAYWWFEDNVVFYGLRGLAFRTRDGSEEARLILEAMSYPDYWQGNTPSKNYIWPMLMALAFMDCARGDVAIMDKEARAAGLERFTGASLERLAPNIYVESTPIRLTAQAATDFGFHHWEGDFWGSEPEVEG